MPAGWVKRTVDVGYRGHWGWPFTGGTNNGRGEEGRIGRLRSKYGQGETIAQRGGEMTEGPQVVAGLSGALKPRTRASVHIHLALSHKQYV